MTSRNRAVGGGRLLTDGCTVPEVTAEIMTRWRCPHCRKHYASKGYATKHAVDCTRNPANRTCSTCVHFERTPCCATASGECGCYGKNDCKLGVFKGGINDEDWLRDCDRWNA